jgi:hypothetical protein
MFGKAKGNSHENGLPQALQLQKLSEVFQAAGSLRAAESLRATESLQSLRVASNYRVTCAGNFLHWSRHDCNRYDLLVREP